MLTSLSGLFTGAGVVRRGIPSRPLRFLKLRTSCYGSGDLRDILWRQLKHIALCFQLFFLLDCLPLVQLLL